MLSESCHTEQSQCPYEVVIAVGAADLRLVPLPDRRSAPSPCSCKCWLLSVYSSSFSWELFLVQLEPPEAIIPGGYSGTNDLETQALAAGWDCLW